MVLVQLPGKAWYPVRANQNLALNMSTPIHVNEGGATWGALAGYEFSPFFALEANYMNYSFADVIFDSLSLFSFNFNGLTRFRTQTETVSLTGKRCLSSLIPK